MAMRRLLIVGSGITGCSLSFLLSRTVRPGALETVLWEKSNGVGGRMATRRSNRVPNGQVDLGAQFFSISSSNLEEHREIFEELINEKVLIPIPIHVEAQREFPTGTVHYVAPNGASSVPKTFLKKSGAEVRFRLQVSKIDLEPGESDTPRWSVSAQDGTKMTADIVVLTMPIPQILSLKGNFSDFISADVRRRLEKVQYSSRYAMGLFYEAGTKMPDWKARFVLNNSCIRYVCQDHMKRGCPEEPPSVIVHTSVPFGLQFLEASPSDINSKLIIEARAALPDLPEPAEIKFHKWRFSQIYSPYEGAPGFLGLHSGPPLLLAGDAFFHSNVSGCLTSAKATAQHLLRLMPDLAV